jgi:transposase-like protein
MGRTGNPPSREEFVSLWEAGVPIAEIARRYGGSERFVRHWRNRFGLAPRMTLQRPKGRDEKFRALWNDASLPRAEVARRMGISRHVARHYARHLGLLDSHDDDGGVEQEDGPGPGDPTPEEIAELAAYHRARRLMQKGFNFDDGDRVWTSATKGGER